MPTNRSDHSPPESLSPTRPNTPIQSSPSIKPIPDNIQLPDGRCQYQSPPSANTDFNPRSPSPTSRSSTKPTHGPMPLKREKAIIIRDHDLLRSKKVPLTENLPTTSNLTTLPLQETTTNAPSSP
ncbi:hypothetical protein BT69DRAFT_1331732 [Atractiella rhizophila]|nr:hypothetical protein BT69DRAFT_1331732 [Atractiella rhizophila]